MRYVLPVIIVASLFVLSMFIPRGSGNSAVYPDGTTFNELGETVISTDLAKRLYRYKSGWFPEEKCFAIVRARFKIYKPIETVEVVSSRVRFSYSNGPSVECKVRDSDVRVIISNQNLQETENVTLKYTFKGREIVTKDGTQIFKSPAIFPRFGVQNLSYREWLGQTESGRKKLEPFLKKVEFETREATRTRREKRANPNGDTSN